MDPRLVSYEDYVSMCGCPPVMGITAMLGHYKLSMHDWTQIATYWNGLIATHPQYVQHGLRVEQEAARLRAGGAPRPLSFAVGAGAPGAPPMGPPLGVPPPGPGAVPPGATPAEGAPHLPPGPPPPVAMHAVSGAMPGAVPPPAYGGPAPGYAAAPPPPAPAQAAWPQPPAPMGYAPQPAPVAPPAYPNAPYPAPGYPPQQPSYNQHAAQLGNEVGNAFNAFGSALDSFVSSAVGGFAVHSPVLVQWSDGQRYPATVLATNAGQVQVVFPDGRQVWVPSQYVVSR